jgi:hypothetical protein
LNSQTEKAKKIGKLNEELGDLVNQERIAYNEERQKLEDELDNEIKQNEAKIKVIKNKLINLLQKE